MPVSLIGTFGVMYLRGFSLDNLSLMALTIATGFVVDDAIVVLENIARHVEQGCAPLEAAMRRRRGRLHRAVDEPVARSPCSSRSCSWAGWSGRLFREFAMTLWRSRSSISLVVSLTTTPMMCGVLRAAQRHATGLARRRSAALHAPRARCSTGCSASPDASTMGAAAMLVAVMLAATLASSC